MEKLLKVEAHDCPICQSLSEIDGEVAEKANLTLEVISLEDLADLPVGDSVRDYVVYFHVNPADGMIDVPVYLVVNENGPQASGVIKDQEELENLIEAWEAYKSRLSAESQTM